MSKLKTHKSIAKRFRITKTGKIKKRTCGQSHFNARETGKVGRQKRTDATLGKAMEKFVLQRLPYSN